MVITGRRAARREEEHVEEHVLGLSADDGDVLAPPPPLLPSIAPPHAPALLAPLAR
jgi:hypothetical protein